MSDLPILAYCNPDDQSKQLRSYLKSLGASKLDDEAKQDTTEDVNEIIDYIDVLNTVDSENDVEMTLDSIVSLLVAVPREHSEKIVGKFCDKLSENFKGKESVLIRVFSNLFYGFGGGSQSSGRQQYRIYCTMLSIAEKSGLVRLMITDLDRIQEWFDVWKLTVDEKRVCLRLLHLSLINGQQVDALAKVMFALLSTYTTDADAVKAKDDAKECIRAAISDPGTYVYDHLLSLKPVQSLSGDKMYELLQIFVAGSLQDYMKFYEKNKEFVTNSLSLSHDALMHKMRVLTLMTVCENRNEVNLVELGSILMLTNNDDLEEFIIKAVQSKAVKVKNSFRFVAHTVAKIDQVHRRLVVGGVKNRSFNVPQWEQLRNKLDSWSMSLRQVKRYLDNVVVVEN